MQKTIIGIDNWQQRHKASGFMYAVIKKYGEDHAGYQAALVTYYGFLSLFPLLLVLTTVGGIVGSHYPDLGNKLVDSVSNYFPVIGQSLNNSVHGSHKNGLALVLGTLLTLYGARGAADAFRHAVNQIWHVPQSSRSGFPKSLLRSFGLIFGGGGGFIAASIIAGWTAAAGHGLGFRLLSLLCNVIILFGVFMLILRLSLPLSFPRKAYQTGAAVSAVGFMILQLVGGLILAHQAKNLTSAYSAVFATTLGLLAWIYLQAQVIMYAVESDTVRYKRLWPRSLSGQRLTEVDKTLKR